MYPGVQMSYTDEECKTEEEILEAMPLLTAYHKTMTKDSNSPAESVKGNAPNTYFTNRYKTGILTTQVQSLSSTVSQAKVYYNNQW